MTLPPGDPMTAPHLLGPGWEAFRWFEDADARDAALERLRRGDLYYRPGDVQSLVLETVDR